MKSKNDTLVNIARSNNSHCRLSHNIAHNIHNNRKIWVQLPHWHLIFWNLFAIKLMKTI